MRSSLHCVFESVSEILFCAIERYEDDKEAFDNGSDFLFHIRKREEAFE